MSSVSRTTHFYRGTSAPSLGRAEITSARRDLTTGTAANGPACALPCLSPEPVAGTCTRPRRRSPQIVRRRQRRHQGRTDPTRRVARSRVGAHRQRCECLNPDEAMRVDGFVRACIAHRTGVSGAHM